MTEETGRLDFIRQIVIDDVRSGKHGGRVVTRFPPEPNGYLHIGHAKSICLNFGIAREFGGRCHLRFDDTNPETEELRYVESIIDMVKWLGFDWGEHLYFASDYFEKMYEYAEHLIREGRAYVDSQTEEEIRENRGTVTEPGRPSPHRDRSVEENLDLFRRMRAGEFPNGAHVLRAKIDLSSPNMLLRDPVLYRIRHASHYRTGDDWCIYPLYDYAHALEDAIECITHSLCTLEFETNRPLYDWVVENTPVRCRPRQYEFARLVLDYTVMSKRKLLELVRDGLVGGWDDPRMPTLAGLRRRGVTPEAIRAFAEGVGVTKANTRVDVGKLEYAIREDLNARAPRVLCVTRPLKLVVTNYPEDLVEEFDAPYWPHDVPKQGSRRLPFSRELYVERDDFAEDPPKGWHRLAPGREVRLRYAYVVRCDEIVRNDAGAVVELHCTYDPATRGGSAPEGRPVRGTIHWVSAARAVPCEVRLYDRLFTVPDPDAVEGEDWKSTLNPESLVVLKDARIEPSVRTDAAGELRYQFERLGYFYADPVDSSPDSLVFNRIVTLRDSWGKRQADVQAEAQTPTKAPAPVQEAGPAREPEISPPAKRLAERHGVDAKLADVIMREVSIAELFDAAVAEGATARLVAAAIVNDLLPELKATGTNELAFTPAALASLLRLVEEGVISAGTAKTVLARMVREGADPLAIVEREGLRQISDAGELSPLVDEVVAANAAKVDAFRAGKTGLLGFFVGEVMRRTGGRGNAEVVQRLIREKLQTR